MNLSNYYWYFKSALSPKFCDDVIKYDLKCLLGEEPAIRLNYRREELVNEGGKESKKLERLESISIFYTYENELNQLLPTEETFIIS